MEELINRITSATGIDAGTAQKAVGLMLGFLRQEGSGNTADELIAAVPGADAIVTEPMGGGIMGLGTQLMGMGLGMGEIQGLAKETIGFAREKGGADKVDALVNSIPGLNQFV